MPAAATHPRFTRRRWLACAGFGTLGLGGTAALLPIWRATPVPGKHWEPPPENAALSGAQFHRLQTLAAGLSLPEKSSGLLVARGGHLLFDQRQPAANGTQPPANLGLNSVGKSLWANLFGVALERGVIASAEQPIGEALPDLAEVVGIPPIPGADFPPLAPHSLQASLLQIANHTDGLFRDHPPGAKFTYGSSNYCALLRAVSRAWDHQHDELGLIHRELLAPIGATARGHHSRQPGIHEAVARLTDDFLRLDMTPEDLLRLAWLWRCHGQWGRNQVIPRAWMRRSTAVSRAIIDGLPRKVHYYGYGFWSNSEAVLWPGLPKDAFSAEGYGGLRVFVCPSADLAAVAWGRTEPGRFTNQVQDAKPWAELLAALA